MERAREAGIFFLGGGTGSKGGGGGVVILIITFGLFILIAGLVVWH